MKILDIENRTENWKTAYYFAPFFRDETARVRLARRLSEPDETQASEVCINLFWKGIRDYLHKMVEGMQPICRDFEMLYKQRFCNLRKDIEEFRYGGRKLKGVKTGENYDVSDYNLDKLYNNLLHTEIDIVLETPSNLYIGEAKHEENFGANADLVLVHQLIRQYVTARILADHKNEKKDIVSFVVVDKEKYCSVMKTAQVRFMIQQDWMRKENVLTWEDIKQTACGT